MNGVYVGNDMLLDIGTSEKGDMEKSAEEINKFSAAYKGAAYFVCVPTSAGVYGETLPPYIEKNSESRQIASLYSTLGTDIRKIDAYNILKMLNELVDSWRKIASSTANAPAAKVENVLNITG